MSISLSFASSWLTGKERKYSMAYFHKYTLIKWWSSNIPGKVYKTDWSWNKESPTKPHVTYKLRLLNLYSLVRIPGWLEPPFLVSILYYLCQVVTSLTWGAYCSYGTPAQCNWVASNCFFVSLIIRIAWSAWCGCDESPCIIYQGNVSKGFDDMIWTNVGNMWETLYMIVLVIELNLMRA